MRADHRRLSLTRSSNADALVSVLERPTRMAPRSRMCAVRRGYRPRTCRRCPGAARSSMSRSRREPPIGGNPSGHRVPHSRPPRFWAGLAILVIPAGVADVRCGGDDHLPVVARVGQGLPVARHTGRKDCLTKSSRRFGAEAPARKARPSSSTDAGGDSSCRRLGNRDFRAH